MFATLYKPISEASPTWAETKITDIFKIISYNYTKKFYEVGSFSMVIPVNEPSAELLETNTFLATDDGDFLFVTSIKETESRIALEGFDLKYLLAGRVTLFPTEEQDRGTYGYYVTKGSTGECICNIVKHNITEASDPNRRIYGFSVSSSAQGLTEDTYMTRLEPLDQVVATLCKNAGIGYDVTMEFGSSLGDGIRFDVIKPTDRSEEQTDVPRVIFAKSFMNVESLSREVGVTAEKNAIYAINGTNIDDAVVKLVNRDGEDKADYGVYRRETTVNVNCDVEEIDNYALKEAEDFISTDSFIMEAAAAESYKKEWFVGDIVTFRHKNVARHVPVIAVEVQRTADKFTVKLSAGESSLKPVSGISRTVNKAADEIKQKKFDDGNVLTVKELPAEGIKNKIYVLEEENGEAAPLADNVQTEETEEAKIIDGYIFVDGKWRKFGGGDDTEGVGEFTNADKTSEIFNCYKDVKNEYGTVTAYKNYINPKTKYSHIAGSSNSIDKDAEEGKLNSDCSSILSGQTNSIKNSQLAAIAGGNLNSIVNRGNLSIIGAGLSNSIQGVTGAAILCGNGGSLTDGYFTMIGAGQRNSITTSFSSGIICGEGNNVSNGSVSSIIAAGSGNVIKRANETGIFTGGNNKMGGSSGYLANCAILLGRSNEIGTGENDGTFINCAILGGENNYLQVSGQNSAIVCGKNNKIKNSGENCILTGLENIIDTTHYSVILGGTKNKISGSTFDLGNVICGEENKIEQCNNTTVFGKSILAKGLANCLIVGLGHSCDMTNNGKHGALLCGKYGIIEGIAANTLPVFAVGGGTSPDDLKNVAYIDEQGNVYAKSFNIIGAEASAASVASEEAATQNADISALAQQVSQMQAEIEALKSEIAQLKGAAS